MLQKQPHKKPHQNTVEDKIMNTYAPISQIKKNTFLEEIASLCMPS